MNFNVFLSKNTAICWRSERDEEEKTKIYLKKERIESNANNICEMIRQVGLSYIPWSTSCPYKRILSSLIPGLQKMSFRLRREIFLHL